MSSTNTLTNLATMYRNGATCIFNLPNPSSQFQIGGANILDAVTSKAPLNSPAFTGVPTAPTATAGTSTGQLATTKFVEDAIIASGVFDPNISYTWGSAYQRFGNDQVICIGSSTMPTTKPIQGGTSSSQGTQICNNTQTQGETDFVNYSNTGAGGFAFQQMSGTNALKTMATMYRSGADTILNLNSASSQFQVNGVNIARQTAVSEISTFLGVTLTMTISGVGVFSTTYASQSNITSRTINGVTSVSVGGPITSGFFLPFATPIQINNTQLTPNTAPTQATTYCLIGQLNGPAPKSVPMYFTMKMYEGTTTAVGSPIAGFGTLALATNGSYYMVFTAYDNFPLNTPICYDPFSFVYE